MVWLKLEATLIRVNAFFWSAVLYVMFYPSFMQTWHDYDSSARTLETMVKHAFVGFSILSINNSTCDH